MKTTVTTRDVGDVKIVELHGKITIGAGDLQMREAIHAAVNAGAIATPDTLVTTCAADRAPANEADAPPAGAANVTETPGSG